jgi:hypothetical protein
VSPAATFELLRFEATPVSATVALVELDGAFTGLEPVRPRLLVESGGAAHEMPAISAGPRSGRSPLTSSAGPGQPWSASFAIPLAALGDPLASFALVPGRGPLIELPPPSDSGNGDDDRFVALARTANDLRHRLTVAVDRAEDRDHLAGELETLRERLAAAEERVAEAHEAAMQAREEQARAEGEADETREALARAREEARDAVRQEIDAAVRDAEEARKQLAAAQEQRVAAEDEARAARIDLRDARARIEALVRESRTARAASARVPAATPRVEPDDDAEFRAARLGPDWGADTEEGIAPAGDAPTTAKLAPVAPPEEAQEASDPESVETEVVEAEAVDEEAPSSGDERPAADEDGPSLWSDDDQTESVRVLRPRTRIARRRPKAVIDHLDEEDVLEPAAVGARLMQPVEASRRRRALAVLTHPRTIVGAIFLLLIAALALIFSGAGPV